ncbi:glycine cleavage system H protein [Desulfarculus baarsii DSM 2075]|uniref:Glycine cleavage system H protein n=1 Tax=Desulfarculus baarsii (strain ATCC 33931 / DSM 2075 / LMG 7858 / VKM B-1802 / 2st14) TaxID=644282 RepID=E1QKX8_DESB2|nr:glycine cleavage system protein GcvH [Desulfarculus baarsii]ADK86337.1 glycine cleavage system H protein [Desulfarculus baarsii DSM 2075]
MNIGGHQIPEELYYDKEHYWLRPEGELLVMGMTDFAQKLAGEIVYVQLPLEGKALSAGKKFAKVESGKWVGKVFAPLDGELVESNIALEDNPGLINSDPYGQGWMFKIRPADMADLDGLIHGAAAIQAWMTEEMAKHGK